MPGARLPSFRFGDNNELLAEFILNVLGFTTRVPRQEDVGHDFVCALAYRQNNLLRAGPLFTVQVKSKREPIVFDKKHEIEWLDNQENPYFICVTHRKDLRIDLYSTWNRRNSFSLIKANKVILEPGKKNELPKLPYPPNSREEQHIPLGRPILTISAHDIVVAENVRLYRKILKDWIDLDRKLIVDQQTGLHWVPKPFAYETNESIPPSHELNQTVYHNPVRHNEYVDGLLRFAFNLREMVKREINEGDKASPAKKMFEKELKFLEEILQFEWIKIMIVDQIDDFQR